MAGFTLEILIEYAEGYLLARFMAVASLCLLLYDHLICLDQEVRSPF